MADGGGGGGGRSIVAKGQRRLAMILHNYKETCPSGRSDTGKETRRIEEETRSEKKRFGPWNGMNKRWHSALEALEALELWSCVLLCLTL